jgi:hypothetical protein
MSYNKWLDTFIEEKGIDLEDTFELKHSDGTTHTMPYGVVVEHIKIASSEEQKQIKEVVVKIDFKNGDVRHFLRYLGQAIIENS